MKSKHLSLLIFPILTFFFISCTGHNFPPPYIQNFELTDTSGKEFKGTLSIMVTNPTCSAVTISLTNCELLVGSTKVGYAQLQESTKIPKRNSTNTTLLVNLNKANVVGTAMTALLFKKSITFSVTGTLIVKKGCFKRHYPLDQTLTLDRNYLQKIMGVGAFPF